MLPEDHKIILCKKCKDNQRAEDSEGWATEDGLCVSCAYD